MAWYRRASLLVVLLLLGYSYPPKTDLTLLPETREEYVPCEVYQDFPIEDRLQEIYTGLLDSLEIYGQFSLIDTACVLRATRVLRLDANIFLTCSLDPKGSLEEVVEQKVEEHFAPCFRAKE